MMFANKSSYQLTDTYEIHAVSCDPPLRVIQRVDLRGNIIESMQIRDYHRECGEEMCCFYIRYSVLYLRHPFIV